MRLARRLRVLEKGLTMNSRSTFWPAVEMDGEPWVRLDNGARFAKWTHDDEVNHNQRLRQAQKYQFFVNAFDHLKQNRIPGDYYEFGCHRVRTFRMALTEARHQNLDQMRFLAFDSFKGLPPTTSDPTLELWHQPGVLATSVEEFRRLVNEHGVYADKIETFPGYYDASLTPELQKKLVARKSTIALVNIDCDLYESAVPVFDFIEPLLQEGSLIYLDDILVGYKASPMKGVARAWLEFQARSRFKYMRHMDIGWWGRCYIAYVPDPAVPQGVI